MLAMVMKRPTESLTSTRSETMVLAPMICYEETSTLVCGRCGHNDGRRREEHRRGHEDEEGGEETAVGGVRKRMGFSLLGETEREND